MISLANSHILRCKNNLFTGFESVSSFHIPLVSSHIACSALHKMGVCLTADEVQIYLVVSFEGFSNKGYLWHITMWISVNITEGLHRFKTLTYKPWQMFSLANDCDCISAARVTAFLVIIDMMMVFIFVEPNRHQTKITVQFQGLYQNVHIEATSFCPHTCDV